MEVRYASNKLEKQCNSEAEAKKAFGPEIGKRLLPRIFQLRSADVLGDLLSPAVPGKWGAKKGDLKGQIGGHVTGNFRVMVSMPDTDDPNTARVVQVEGIVDYH